MASTPYDRQTSFALLSAENPLVPHSGITIDAEFNAVKVALDDTQQNLALLQDDDGVLKRGSVGQAQLDSSVSLGFGAPTTWAADTTYDANVSTVFEANKFYVALVDHTSGVSFDATKWLLLADFTTSAVIPDGSITSVKLAAGAVDVTKLADGSITPAKLASLAVTTTKIADSAVTTPKLADANVTTVKIADLNVTTAKLAASGVTFAKVQDITASRLLGNPTGVAGSMSEILLGTGLSFSGSTLNAAAIPPTVTTLLSGTAATYTTPAGVKWLEVTVVGGGAGGGGGNSAVASTAGGTSSFGSLSAGGGAGSTMNASGAGGSSSSGNLLNLRGAPGGVGNTPGLNHNSTGGTGGSSTLGGGGQGSSSNTTGGAALANSGSGGGGGGSNNGSLDGSAGCGGASGGTVRHTVAPSASQTFIYTVGAGGAGAAGASISSSAGGAGGAGAAGYILIIEHY